MKNEMIQEQSPGKCCVRGGQACAPHRRTKNVRTLTLTFAFMAGISCTSNSVDSKLPESSANGATAINEVPHKNTDTSPAGDGSSLPPPQLPAGFNSIFSSYALPFAKAEKVLFAKDAIWVYRSDNTLRVFRRDGSELTVRSLPQCEDDTAEPLQVAADGITSLWTCGEIAMLATLSGASATESIQLDTPYGMQRLVMSPDAKAWLATTQLGINFAVIGQPVQKVLRTSTTEQMYVVPCGKDGIAVSGKRLYLPNAEVPRSNGIALVRSDGKVQWLTGTGDTLYSLACTTKGTGMIAASNGMHPVDIKTGAFGANSVHLTTTGWTVAIAPRDDGFWAFRDDDEKPLIAVDTQVEIVAEGPDPGGHFCGESPSGESIAICTDTVVHIVSLPAAKTSP